MCIAFSHVPETMSTAACKETLHQTDLSEASMSEIGLQISQVGATASMTLFLSLTLQDYGPDWNV